MKIAYITDQNANNINSWSGILYHMSKSLEKKNIDIIYINAMDYIWEEIIISIKNNPLKGENSMWHYINPVTLKNASLKLEKYLKNIQIDLIMCHGTLPVAFLENKVPLVCWEDSTSKKLISFYNKYKDLDLEIKNLWFETEKTAFYKSSALIFPSEWAANSAFIDYEISKDKIKVIPFGANLNFNGGLKQISKVIDDKKFDKCKLLFVGKDWERKGGNLVIKIAQYLNEKGLDTELNIVGSDIKNNYSSLPKFVKNIGFIDKSSQNGINFLSELFLESHFLLVPSRAECYGIVFCEASSFALPSLSTNVGGISSCVTNDINGKLFSLQADEKDYGDYIISLFENSSEYKKLAFSSFQEYKDKLNWETTANKIKTLFEEIISQENSQN